MSKIKLYKPTNPGRRKTSVIDYKAILTTNEPYKPLTKSIKNRAGRNSAGKITIRHRGGGQKRLYREISFKHNFVKGFKVSSIEYDPNRTSFISLVVDIATGKKHYILFTKGMKVGQTYSTDDDLSEGYKSELKNLLIGTQVSQIELNPGQGSKIVRSAGAYAEVTAKEDKYVTLKLPSGEVRKFLDNCLCSVGRVGNESHELVRMGKAGRIRRLRRRPQVRGKVMNPVDHPHGGGEARNSIGMKYPKTPWGKHALGVKTRDKKRTSSRLIVKRRK
jgi:large subunit ribosomal protein L2